MNDTLRGAVRSKTVWLNVALAIFSAVELAGSQLTLLVGPKWTAGIMLCGSIVNVALRAYTAPLSEKAP